MKEARIETQLWIIFFIKQVHSCDVIQETTQGLEMKTCPLCLWIDTICLVKGKTPLLWRRLPETHGVTVSSLFVFGCVFYFPTTNCYSVSVKVKLSFYPETSFFLQTHQVIFFVTNCWRLEAKYEVRQASKSHRAVMLTVFQDWRGAKGETHHCCLFKYALTVT